MREKERERESEEECVRERESEHEADRPEYSQDTRLTENTDEVKKKKKLNGRSRILEKKKI